jgi:hypothetical protein
MYISEQIFAFLESGIPVLEIESQRAESLLTMAISDKPFHYHEATVYDTVSELLSLGCNPNSAVTGKDSPLILSVKKRFLKIVNLFISKGVNLNHKGVDGNTAIHVCSKKGTLFCEYGACSFCVRKKIIQVNIHF